MSRACDKSRLDIAPGMGDAAIAFELKRQAYDADCPPNPSKRCKVAGPSEESFSNREIRENLSDKAAANASSSITCSAREQHEHDDQLRGLLALLKDSEQNIRKMRGACCTESDFFLGNGNIRAPEETFALCANPQSGRLPLNGIDGLLILFVMFIFLSFTLFLFRVHDFPNLMIGI